MAVTFTVRDDHNDNSLSSAIWNLPAWGGAPVAENNNCLEITSSLASGYYGIDTPRTHNLTGSMAVAQLRGPLTSAITSLEGYPMVVNADDTGNNQLLWFASPFFGVIRAFKKIAGVSTQVGGDITYSTAITSSPNQKAYFGVMELAGITYWIYSYGGKYWRIHYSEANPLTITTVKMGYMEGTWQAELTQQAMQFDNLNFILRRIS